MVERKRRLLSAAVLWLIETAVGLLRGVMRAGKLKPLAKSMLEEALSQGHTSMPLRDLALTICSQNEGIAEQEVGWALRRLHHQGVITIRGLSASLPHVAQSEETIARGLLYVGRDSERVDSRLLTAWIADQGDRLNNEQRAALSILTTAPVTILTGGPGTGKTSLIQALTAILEQAKHQVHLAAPTGRAAARLSEVTNRPAQTLHRLLYGHSRQRALRHLTQLGEEAIIIDEASMLDVFIAARLIKFCTPRTRLILVGDADQLPPVQPGQVFHDLIESGQIPIVKLTWVYRQAENSVITSAAREIKAGVVPSLPAPGSTKSDCYFIEADSPAQIKQLVTTAATSSLPKRCGADPHRNVQVLTPMNEGPLGTRALNKLIRQSLDRRAARPTSVSVRQAHDFRPNDRVIQVENDYELGVFNGECGIVEEVAEKCVTVGFNGRRVKYTQIQCKQLSHGYAITIHRSQGSEYPFVIIPIHESHSKMLSRQLLYTALTRGRQMVVFIGSQRALTQAISAQGKRHTGLKDLICATSIQRATAQSVGRSVS